MENWEFKGPQSAATLERVVPVTQKQEAPGEFILALASIEFYGEGGCVVSYKMDIYSPKLAEPGDLEAEESEGYLWSDTHHIFVIRDENGREYQTAPREAGFSGDDEVEYFDGSFIVEPLASGTEITVELREIIRETCYHEDPDLAKTGDEETVSERLWEGVIAFRFSI